MTSSKYKQYRHTRLALLFGSAMTTCFAFPGWAFAQDSAANNGASQGGLAEIVVTAQKREQTAQDVPISISVLSATDVAEMQINRFSDIGANIPGLRAYSFSGGSSSVGFTLRGSAAAAVAPGADASIALAIDGVFISASSGNDFDIPNISRLEVLKGPQGTLFGRNSTAGVVSISTADPKDDFDLQQQITFGNYEQFISRTTVNTGSFGPFSAMVTYVRNKRAGDIKNLGAGTVWDYSRIPGYGKRTSPDTLGDKDNHGVYAALRFEPSDSFRTVYKFDWSKNTGTPEGGALSALNIPQVVGIAGFFGVTFTEADLAAYRQAVAAATHYKRPKAINAAFHIPVYMKAYGHNLTSTLTLSDQVSIKNIAAYRYADSFGAYQLDNLGGVTVGGVPFVTLATTTLTQTKQWSDEIQLNANLDFATLTVGALYFHTEANKGAVPGAAVGNNVQFARAPGFVIPAGIGTVTNTKGTQLAAFAQGEFHLTPQLDVVAGIRITQDKKTGNAVTTSPAGTSVLPFNDYKKTLPSYQVGLNFKPNDDILLYGKFAHSFVSGGQISVLEFDPEKADSFEIGVKADLLDRRLRTNLALYTVKYNNIQSGVSGTLICTDGTPSAAFAAGCPAGNPSLSAGVVVVSLGDARAKGFEFEATALPVEGLTLSGNLAYTDFKYTRLSLYSQLSQTVDAGRPKWGAGVKAEYDTGPIFDTASLVVSADANYHSRFWFSANIPTRQLDPHSFIPAAWVANARAEFKGIDISGHTASIGLWVRNAFDNKAPLFGAAAGPFTFTNFQPARTFGVDLGFDF
jgi:iron complex outermembrane receptor protein